jgi:hypothetical protein
MSSLLKLLLFRKTIRRLPDYIDRLGVKVTPEVNLTLKVHCSLSIFAFNSEKEHAMNIPGCAKRNETVLLQIIMPSLPFSPLTALVRIYLFLHYFISYPL